MKEIVISEMEEILFERLRERARSNARSLQDEIKTILKQAATVDIVSARNIAESIRLRLRDRSFSDSAELLRRERESH